MKKIFILLTIIFGATFSSMAVSNWGALKDKANQQFEVHNYKDAFNIYKKLFLDYKATPEMYSKAIESLKKARLEKEFDSFFAAMVEKYGKRPEMALAMAKSKMEVASYGYIIAGEFVRGDHRGGGERVSSVERDRVEALGLIFSVVPELSKAKNGYPYYQLLSDLLIWGRRGDQAWKLQYLTDVKELPDYDKNLPRRLFSRLNGAPVDGEGNPVFYHVPKSFDAALNDGERWRWAIAEILNDEKVVSADKLNVQKKLADFFWSQFGVHTLSFNMRDKIKSIEAGPYALHLLKDDETIAQLANGARKITLPDDCNYIKMYNEILKINSGFGAVDRLVDIYKNRRQYVKAAELLKDKLSGKLNNDKLQQIIGSWVELMNSNTFPAGINPEVNLKFRNTRKIYCKITEVKIKTFIADIKDFLKQSQTRKEMFKLGYQPSQVGNWLIKKQGEKYLGEEVQSWEQKLEPLAGHFDKVTQLKLPVKKAGAYFLEVTAEDGNTSRIIVWISSLALIERAANNGKLYIVTDALTGKPVDFCRLKFFGYKSKYIRDKSQRAKNGERYTFSFNEFYTQTDDKGMIFVDAAKLQKCGNVMIEAEFEDRFGVLGFNNVYCRRFDVQKMDRMKRIFGITDRPIYRPGQTVKFNYWLRYVGYGIDDYIGAYAGRKVTLTVRSPRKKLLEKEFVLDNLGSFNSSFKLPEDADLGNYYIGLIDGGYLNFKVEEYRKPEYEVKVSMPEKPLMLGDEIPITINADYLFGAPVTNAKVNYKIYRTSKEDVYIPFFKWDWLYGDVGSLYRGCYRHISWQRRQPVELVANNVGETDSNGELTIKIDTSLTKALFGDTDSEYKVVAEVTDQSRYTEVGEGSIIASCKAFKVFCDTNKGFYQTSDVVELIISAKTANDKKVDGKYKVDLFKISYNDNQEPVETGIKSWNGEKTLEDAVIKFRLDEVGHYLAKTQVTDSHGSTISSETIIQVTGKGITKADKMTTLPLEMVADKKTYQPGDVASIMINTAESDQNIFLFVRPASAGMVNYAKVMYLPTGSEIKQLRIGTSDMPNIFVEAVMVRNGKAYSVVKQIIVPPEKKILNIELKTAENKYKPGEKCPLKVKITDSNGTPVSGDVVLTVYDKALDILSGGSNVPEINSFFWKWKRSWYSQSRNSLDKYFYQIFKPQEQRMRQLGIFGYLPAPNMEGLGRGQVAYLSQGVAKKMTFDSVAEASPNSGGGEEQANVVVRENFADSVLWKVALKTDAEGIAELPVPLPDNLTTWKIRAWAMTDKCSVGQGESEVIVSKDYLVRLILPRFLNTGDVATVSAIVMNLTDKSGKAVASIDVAGDALNLINASEQSTELKADGEKRFDWQVKAVKPGKAVITAKSIFGDDSDALKLNLPVEIKGITKQVSTSGYMQARRQASLVVDIPEKRKEGSTKLTINFSPSIAVAMVDALPYLINTDDKDVFSTINRFIPALIARNTLKKMGVDLAAVEKMQSNLNPVELGDKKTRAAQWKRFKCNPVFSSEQLEKIVSKELNTLIGMQNSDGGWGWFSGFYEHSYVYTTVKTVRALSLAVESGLVLDKNVLTRGVDWLKAWQERRIKLIKEDHRKVGNTDALVFATLVKSNIKSDFMLEKLFKERNLLSINGLTLLAASCEQLKDNDKLKVLLENIEQFLVEDSENQTAYLRIPETYWWWCWYGRDIDTQAAYLKLLSKVDPKGKRAAWLAKYILINRKHSTYWTSVADTGLCVEALCEFIEKSGEGKPDMTLQVLFDGKLLKEVKINAGNMFNIDNSIELADGQLSSGKHEIEFRREGQGTVYFNTYLSYFTLEDSIKHAGLDLKVRRKYYKLVAVDSESQARGDKGQALKVSTEKYKRVKIDDLSKISSGDLIEIEFTIDSKNDYEYIVIDDGKPAGFEPVSILSGYTQNNLGAFVETRDKLTRFYVRRLARGKHSMSYRMRAVTPGKFTALPAIATGVYAPELRCNSDEFRVNIK
jgi:uncharacterized protein YfaS (alpha-2-macroglobulin family)